MLLVPELKLYTWFHSVLRQLFRSPLVFFDVSLVDSDVIQFRCKGDYQMINLQNEEGVFNF